MDRQTRRSPNPERNCLIAFSKEHRDDAEKMGKRRFFQRKILLLKSGVRTKTCQKYLIVLYKACEPPPQGANK